MQVRRAVGNRTSWRRRDGRVFGFGYDALNRVTSKAVPTGCAPIQQGPCPAAAATRSVYYGYDLGDRQLFARFDNADGEGLSNAYDNLGQLTAATTTMGGVTRTLSYRYDVAGNRVQVTHPDANGFTFTYDVSPRRSIGPRPTTAAPMTTISTRRGVVADRP